jgi:hypothetical protein
MMFSPNDSATSCRYCQSGTFNNVTGSTGCERCREPSACYCSRR